MMKKFLLICFLSLSLFGFGQKLYTKISDSKVNQERLKVAESFINQYLDKCKNKDYSEFTDFTISKRIEKELNTEREKACLDTESVKIVSFDSAHLLDYAKQEDPVELFVFNINNEKDPTLRYISTWVYHDKNVIGGLWVSKEKPLYRKKKKQASEKTK